MEKNDAHVNTKVIDFSSFAFRDATSSSSSSSSSSPPPPPITVTKAPASMPTQPSSSLNEDQQRAFDLFQRGCNVFITGAGGTGKSHLIRAIQHDCSLRNRRVKICATTGTAAVLLQNGATTIHSFTGIGIAKGTVESIVDYSAKRLNRRFRKEWKQLDVLIVDEISMMSAKLLDILLRVCKVHRRTAHRHHHHHQQPFGGLQVIFTGDFFQLPPVNTDRADIENGQFAFEHPEWDQLFPPSQCVELRQVVRQQGDAAFVRALTEIRRGQVSDEVDELLRERMLVSAETSGMVYTRLYPVKRDVDLINQRNYEELTTSEFMSQAMYCDNNTRMLDTGAPIAPAMVELCQSLTPDMRQKEFTSLLNSLQCVETLRLKVGTVVMLTYNISLERGLCNGSMGKVTQIQRVLGEFVSRLRVTVQFNNGLETEIPYKSFQSSQYPCLSVSQLPLMMAWATTIHKSQGSTMDAVEMDIGKNIFAKGQTYVALSRVKSLQGLFLTDYDRNQIQADETVRAFYDRVFSVCS